MAFDVESKIDRTTREGVLSLKNSTRAHANDDSYVQEFRKVA